LEENDSSAYPTFLISEYVRHTIVYLNFHHIYCQRTAEIKLDSRLDNEELHNLYSSPSIIGMIKSRKMRRTGHVRVARMGEKRNAYRIIMGKPEEKETSKKV
jgi:hypothetical protein